MNDNHLGIILNYELQELANNLWISKNKARLTIKATVLGIHKMWHWSMSYLKIIILIYLISDREGIFFSTVQPASVPAPTGRGRAMVRGQFNPRQCLQPTGRGRATVWASFLCTGHHEGPRGQACQKSKPQHCNGDLRNESITALRRAVPSALSPRLHREWSAGACLS